MVISLANSSIHPNRCRNNDITTLEYSDYMKIECNGDKDSRMIEGCEAGLAVFIMSNLTPILKQKGSFFRLLFSTKNH